MAKKRARKREGAGNETPSPGIASFSEGELTAEVVLTQGVQRLYRALGIVAGPGVGGLGREQPIVPKGDAGAIRRAASAARSDARARARQAQQEIKLAAKWFDAVLPLTNSNRRDQAKARKEFDRRVGWAQLRVKEFSDVALAVIARAQFWGVKLLRADAFVFAPYFFPLPEFEEVWRAFEFHNIGGVPVPVMKIKTDIVFLGLRINFATVNFPHFPGWTPPPKVLPENARTTTHGVTIRALDTQGIETGNPVLPADNVLQIPPTNFWGYGKIFYATGLAAGCRIQFKQVVIDHSYLLPAGAGAGGWIDIAAAGVPSGTANTDPPGAAEYPSTTVGPGTSMMADMVQNSLPPGTPVCTHLSANSLFRTWCVLHCPAGDTTLGYWEWSVRMILHMTAGGLVSLPGAPGGVPAPPNGWPAPGAGSPQWVDAANADPNAAADYGNLFP